MQTGPISFTETGTNPIRLADGHSSGHQDEIGHPEKRLLITRRNEGKKVKTQEEPIMVKESSLVNFW